MVDIGSWRPRRGASAEISESSAVQKLADKAGLLPRTIADFDKAAKPMPSHRVTVGSNELCCPVRMLVQKLRVTEQLNHLMDEAWLDAAEDGPRQVREAAFADPEAFLFSFAANEDGTRCLNMRLGF